MCFRISCAEFESASAVSSRFTCKLTNRFSLDYFKSPFSLISMFMTRVRLAETGSCILSKAKIMRGLGKKERPVFFTRAPIVMEGGAPHRACVPHPANNIQKTYDALKHLQGEWDSSYLFVPFIRAFRTVKGLLRTSILIKFTPQQSRRMDSLS